MKFTANTEATKTKVAAHVTRAFRLIEKYANEGQDIMIIDGNLPTKESVDELNAEILKSNLRNFGPGIKRTRTESGSVDYVLNFTIEQA